MIKLCNRKMGCEFLTWRIFRWLCGCTRFRPSRTSWAAWSTRSSRPTRTPGTTRTTWTTWFSRFTWAASFRCCLRYCNKNMRIVRSPSVNLEMHRIYYSRVSFLMNAFRSTIFSPERRTVEVCASNILSKRSIT